MKCRDLKPGSVALIEAATGGYSIMVQDLGLIGDKRLAFCYPGDQSQRGSVEETLDCPLFFACERDMLRAKTEDEAHDAMRRRSAGSQMLAYQIAALDTADRPVLRVLREGWAI